MNNSVQKCTRYDKYLFIPVNSWAATGSSSVPKLQYITLYVLLLGIGGGLFVVGVVLYCCKICMGRRFDYIMSRETMKGDSEIAAGGDAGTNGNPTTQGQGGIVDKKSCVVQYSKKGGPAQVILTGGLQRKVSEEHQGFASLVSRSPRDTDGFKTSSTSASHSDGGILNSNHKFTTPPHSPHYLTTSTVISIEPAYNRINSSFVGHSQNVSPSSSSSSLQLDSHHSNQNSELPSPRSPKSRHNSGGGSSLSRCGSRGSGRETRASMKSIPRIPSSSFRRPVGGSLKDCERRNSHLTINQDSSPRRRSVSLRSPRHPHSRSPQSKEGNNLLPFGLYGTGGVSENSVHAVRDRNGNDHKTMEDSRHLSTSGQWSQLESGLDYWRRKHKMELVQHENVNMKVRYYDMGSMEDIHNSDFSDFSLFPEVNIEDSSSSAKDIHQQQSKHQYSEKGSERDVTIKKNQKILLWELRATLEEEDWAAAKNPSKILRMGGPSLSPTVQHNQDPGRKEFKDDTQALLASSSTPYFSELSPDRDPLSSHTTSFESNTEPICVDELGPRGHQEIHRLGQPSHATLASRRQSYKNVLQNRMKRLDRSASIKCQETGNVTETTTSFDSIESTSTDTSRLEAITTSIESTDNTDSTGESHQYQQQMGKFKLRAESGYKSLENGPNQNNIPNRMVARRCLSTGSNSVDTTSSSSQASKQPLLGGSFRGGSSSASGSVVLRNNDDTNVFFAKVGQHPPPPSRNVARKRRDFGRCERHSIGSLDSVREPLDEESCGSGQGDGGQGRAKGSLFYRYFRNARSNSARDYSIDKKSDQLFREFSRCDPTFDMTKIYARRSSSARSAGTTSSFDFGSGQQQQRPQSSIITSTTNNSSSYSTNLSTRRASHCDGSVDDELPLIIESSRGVGPNTRFAGHGPAIPIITVDDS